MSDLSRTISRYVNQVQKHLIRWKCCMKQAVAATVEPLLFVKAARGGIKRNVPFFSRNSDNAWLHNASIWGYRCTLVQWISPRSCIWHIFPLTVRPTTRPTNMTSHHLDNTIEIFSANGQLCFLGIIVKLFWILYVLWILKGVIQNVIAVWNCQKMVQLALQHDFKPPRKISRSKDLIHLQFSEELKGIRSIC